MMDGLNDISGLLVQVAILIAVLAVVWFGARLLLRLTIRIFAMGCFLILAIGICVFAFRAMG